MDITRDIININPRERANLLEILFFSYTIQLFIKGYKKNLDTEDLYNPLSTDTSARLGNRLEEKWKVHLEKVKKTSENPSLLKVIAQTFWLEYVLCGGILLIEYVFRLTQPLVLAELLEYFSPESTKTQNIAFAYAGGVILLNLLFTLCANHYGLAAVRLGLNLKTATCAVIYNKTLKLNRTVLGESASGTVVNLIANDVGRFDAFAVTSHFLWMGPFTLIVSGYFLWSKASYAGMIGLIPILVIIPMQGFLGKLAAKFRLQTAYRTDGRIRLMDEIISGIQVIKMYAWEEPFAQIIKIARQLELEKIIKLSNIKGLFMTFNLFITRVSLFSSLAAIALIGQQFSTADAFVFMCYFNILANSMSFMFASGVSQLAESLVSVERVQKFLLSDEFQRLDAIKNYDSKVAIRFSKLTTKWELDAKENALDNVNVSIRNGTLVGVIGPVGSGKSCFLQTIMGELYLANGAMDVNGSISYSSQEAWIFPATIRQNIIFGEEFERHKYNEVIKVCALEKDLKQFLFGDLSLVGEKGVMLSGGQKARISLARTIYRDADIYLLDDPLSAVDVAVGKHLYDNCINGFLANKTRILVTHQVHHLRSADNIIILKNGTIEMEGTFEELLRSENYYAKSLTQESKTNLETGEQKTKKRMSFDNKRTSIISRSSMAASNLMLNNFEKEYTLNDLQEESSEGKIKGSLFLKYIFAEKNYTLVGIVCTLFILSQLLASTIDYYVSYWAEKEEHYKFEKNINATVEFSRTTYLSTYSGLLLALLVIASIRVMSFYHFVRRNSEHIHNVLFRSVVSTNMLFFEKNPTGRILNRFAKDIGSYDETLPRFCIETTQDLLILFGSVALVAIIIPYMLIPIAIITVVFLILKNVYLRTSVNLLRMEGINCSSVFSHLNVTLQGLPTVRSFGAEKILKKELDKFQDLHSSAFYMYDTVGFAFGFFLDMLSFIFTSIVIFSCVLLKNGSSSAEVGLAITQALALTGILQWSVRYTSELVNHLTSVERVLEYIKLPSEKQPGLLNILSSEWPEFGNIVFENVALKYSNEEDYALKNLNITIKSKEKVGIVGRTGAGKSSLISALFRLAIVEGEIKIDNISTGDIDLQTLRSKISIIPQDPVLFSGTLRYNLDPFKQYPDDYLYKALEEVELKDPLNIINRLEYRVLDKGSNYSVGQKQLICLARALVRKNRILILDEATANVDPQTDVLIQKTIREKFANCTVLTVAHRLNTIMDSDRVLVIDSGTVAEFDHPNVLLQDKDGLFYKMVADTGKSTAEQLISIAQNCFEKKYLNW